MQNQEVEENAESVEINASEEQESVITQDSQAEEVQQEPVQQELDQEELDQQDSGMLQDQISRTSQDDNYQTAIVENEQDDTIQFSNLVTQPFLSRSIRIHIIEVGCLSFTQMLQEYLKSYPPPSHADTYLQIQQMAQWLDVYLGKYPAQYINCMTTDSEFVAFVNHTIQLVLDLTFYPNIWAVLSILLETQDVNTSYVQTMHDYYIRCYDTRTQDYMVLIEKAAEQSKNNMCNNTLDGVSAYVQQSVCNSPVPVSDQQEANAENCTQLPYHAHFNDILTEYPAWSNDTNDTENTNPDQYRSHRQEILTAWQKDTPIKMPDNRQVLDN